jgi:molecular chaperone GrpE
MFYKKKKAMNETASENMHENADNMSQNAEENVNAASEGQDNGFETDEQNDQEQENTDKLQLELQEAKDKYLRLAAEFDNFRRRNAKERIELVQTAGKDIIHSLLTVLDDAERAAQQLEKANDINALKEGLSLVFNKLHNTLHGKGLRVMESMNQPFDPELHDAITEIPAPSEDMIGKVIDVVEPGYYLNDKLIRHAKVVVGK